MFFRGLIFSAALIICATIPAFSQEAGELFEVIEKNSDESTLDPSIMEGLRLKLADQDEDNKLKRENALVVNLDVLPQDLAEIRSNLQLTGGKFLGEITPGKVRAIATVGSIAALLKSYKVTKIVPDPDYLAALHFNGESTADELFAWDIEEAESIPSFKGLGTQPSGKKVSQRPLPQKTTRPIRDWCAARLGKLFNSKR